MSQCSDFIRPVQIQHMLLYPSKTMGSYYFTTLSYEAKNLEMLTLLTREDKDPVKTTQSALNNNRKEISTIKYQ